MAPHHPARSFWLCRTRNPAWTLSCDSLRRLCGSLQQGHLLVKSIYLHDTRRVLHDHIVEGERGWVLQGVVSRGSFRRAAASGQTVFTVLSLYINNVYAKKRGIAKKVIQAVRALMISQELIWLQVTSMVQLGVVAAVTISVLLMRLLLIVLCLRRQAPNVCEFLKPPGSQRFWKVNKHGAFSKPRQSSRVTRQWSKLPQGTSSEFWK